MKKLSLKPNAFNKGEVLTRAQLKKVMGGDGSGGGGGGDGGNVCKNSQGGCDSGANCKRSSGAAGKCGSNQTVTCGCI